MKVYFGFQYLYCKALTVRFIFLHIPNADGHVGHFFKI